MLCVVCVQATPAAPANISHDVIEALTKRTQDGGTEVVNAKAGKVRRQAASTREGRQAGAMRAADGKKWFP